MKKYELITILGPTACGKTHFAAAWAFRLHTEIISADSRQVYRRMDIGTGKDLADYVVEGQRVACHLVDICEPGTRYNVLRYQHDFFDVFQRLREGGLVPILCGGTGMYIEAVLKGYRLLDVPPNEALRERLKDVPLAELERILASYKTLHNKTDVDSAQRAIRAIEIEEYYRSQSPERTEFAPINSLIIGLDIDRELRRERISRRLVARLDEGLIDAGRGDRGGGFDVLRAGISLRDGVRDGATIARRNDQRAGDGHPPVCQAADDMVSRHGTAGLHDPLDRCHATRGGDDPTCRGAYI